MPGNIGPRYKLKKSQSLTSLYKSPTDEQDVSKICDLGRQWAKLGSQPSIQSIAKAGLAAELGLKKSTSGAKLPKISKDKILKRSGSEVQMTRTTSIFSNESISRGATPKHGDLSDIAPGTADSGRPSSRSSSNSRPGSKSEQKVRKAAWGVEKVYGRLVPEPKKPTLDESNKEGNAFIEALIQQLCTDENKAERPGRVAQTVPQESEAGIRGPTVEVEPPEPMQDTMESQAPPPTMNTNEGLECFDQPDIFEDHTEQEWIRLCRAEPRAFHAHALHFQNNSWTMVPVWVLDFDFERSRYIIETKSGQQKCVKRLSLRFNKEDAKKWLARIQAAKEKRDLVQAAAKLLHRITSLPDDPESIAPMTKEHKEKFIRAAIAQMKVEDAPEYVAVFRQLIVDIEESYVLAMKFSSFKEQIFVRHGFPDAYIPEEDEHFNLLAVFLPNLAPYYGLKAAMPVGSASVKDRLPLLEQEPVLSRKLYDVLHKVHLQFEQVSSLRFLDVDRGNCEAILHMGSGMSIRTIAKKLKDARASKAGEPFPSLHLKDFLERMQEHQKQVVRILQKEWRIPIIDEVQGSLDKVYNFFIDNPFAHREMYLHRLLARIDFALNTQMSRFCETSLQDWVGFVRSFLPSPKKVLPDTLLILKIKEGEYGCLTLDPSPERLREVLVELTLSAVDASDDIQRCEEEMIANCNLDPVVLHHIGRDSDTAEDAARTVDEVVETCLEGPMQLLEQYRDHESILQRREHSAVDPEDLGAVRNEVQKYFTAIEQIEAISASVEKFPMFEVHCQDIVSRLTKRANHFAEHILAKVHENCEVRMLELSQRWAKCQATVRNPVRNEKELADLKEYMKDIQKVIDPQVQTLAHLRRQLDVLDSFFYQTRADLVEEIFKARHWPLTIIDDVRTRIREIEKEKTKFMDQLNAEKKKFEADMKRWRAKLAHVKEELNSFDDARLYEQIVNGLHEALMDGRKRVEDFNQREHLFSIELTDRERIEGLIEDYDKYFRMWTIAIDFTYHQEQWLSQQLTTLDAEEVANNVDDWYKATYKLLKTFSEIPIQKAVLEDMIKAMKKFKEYLPIIEALCHPAITTKHWFDLFEEMDVDPEGEFGELTMSLTRLLDVNISQYIPQIQGISASAQKEYGLRKSLMAMKKEWAPMCFETMPCRDTGTYLIKGIDEIQTLIDDHIIKTQAIRGSPFCKPFEKECKEWELRLAYIQDCIDQVLMCQRNWLYLEPVFTSGDIVRQMPAETQKFKLVDVRWRQTMASVAENPSVLDFSEIDNLLSNFQEANRLLDQIQKNLNDYLETKRLYFPRFFFLSNDELLNILSETKDPTRVQPHMNKAFEGIAKVVFNEKNEFAKKNEIIEAMVSQEGEVVQLINKVNVVEGDKKGNVERWLLEVEDSMSHALRTNTDDSISAYQATSRTEWVLQWPGQVVICVDMIFYTHEVASALDSNAVGAYFSTLQEQLSGLVRLVRGELTKLARRTLAALTTIDVHNRDVVNDLMNKNVKDSESFEWLAQLRYYWQKPETITLHTGKPNKRVECQVKMVNSCLLYAFEYLGNSDRLVITPLTDRCYRTLMGAYHLYYGGAPEGPAGTGKTESTKDLAKAVAIQCVVFNCSDGLDYLAMGKFFKGLASSGAWCCFDEFNRINVEVLSVIAAQVMTIQLAIREQKKQFIFEGSELKLNPSCAINITMNPGYAGRAELPDNLKALFRPCAMMVPDYALIGEIFLYSYGFEAAKEIGRKATQALRLSSEQLSPQDHYDFGMRGLKSLLVASGALKRKYGDSLPEATLALRAFLDVNQPKFTAVDIPLFQGIVGDLFPGVELPPADNKVLEDSLVKASVNLGLQPTPNHILKAVQLWETILVRHGLMTVGLPPSGKTSINNTLASALEDLADGELFMPVTKYVVNPKSITQSQLYGSFDENTHEWADGILALAVRAALMAGEERRQWLILDGPVDAIWIEDMNTVLDDNKKLCLLSGEIIKLSSVTNMLFEVADLAVASPATVSRCGMVFLEPQSLGWRPIVQSWLERQPHHIQSCSELIWDLHDANADVAIEVLKGQKVPIPSPPAALGLAGWLISSTCRFLQSLLMTHCPAEGKVLEKKELEARLDHLFYFALLWTVGVATDENGRSKMDELVRDLIVPPEQGILDKWGLVGICGWHAVPNKQTLPQRENGALYDYFIDENTGKWTPWSTRLKQLVIPAGSQFHQIIVPTVDMARNQYAIEKYIDGGFHVMLTGVTGTGKSVCVQNMLLSGFDKDRYTSMSFAFSAQTTANQTQDIIDGKLDKRRKAVFGPPVGKTMVIFVDDLNMPAKETYGAQPPIEILRQFMFQNGWYDRKTCEFRQLVDVQFLAAMGPPGAGKNDITARYLWHYNLIYVTPYVGDGLSRIFSTILKWYLGQLGTEPAKQVGMLVNASVDIYDTVSKELLPTPAKCHYTFNLRDLGRIFQGICLCTKGSVDSGENELLKCWAHEVQRVFQDRLVNVEDQSWFEEILAKKMEVHFKKKWSAVVKVSPLIWGDFMDNQQIYKEITDHEAMVEKMKEYLADFNSMAKHQMKLVLFLSFVQHVARVVRVLRLPSGNALCVGVGGSGRKSVATLGTFVVDSDLFQIEISKSYGVADWQEDLKRLLLSSGAQGKSSSFLFSDTQVQQESFLEDVSNILNTGEVPNLFNSEDRVHILDTCAKKAQEAGCSGSAETFAWFIEQCKKNLHIVLCVSPIGEAFRARLRNYPSLVNCCTIDWFMEWPQEALQRVAQQFLTGLDFEEPTLKAVVSVCVEMQLGVYDLTKRFRTDARRHYYVTPTSYLELISSFQVLLDRKRDNVLSTKSRYDKGLMKMNSTAKMVADMQMELEELQPVLKQTSVENAKMMKVIEKNQKEAEVTKQNVEKEEMAANRQADEANAMKADCQADLDQALPALNSAMAALNSLSKNDVIEIKTMKHPPGGVLLTAEALCAMFNIKATILKDQNGKKKGEDYWEPAKKTLFGDPKLLEKLVQFDKDNIDPAVMKRVALFEQDPNFDPEIVRRASVAACGICKWVRAMIMYDRVSKNVAPKRAKLKEAEADLSTAMKNLEEKKGELKTVMDAVTKLENDLAASKQKQMDLAQQVDECTKRLGRAEKLIGGLGGERSRWEVSSEKLGEDFINLTGDILVSSGIIAYLGVFTTQYRNEATAHWISMLGERGIPASPNFVLQDVAGDQVAIRQWIIDKLPNDSFSIDNGIIMSNSRRWPLMIDPQLQANRWIRNMWSEKIKVVKPSQSDYGRILESSISFGTPVLLENVEETLDPMLQPLLQKAIFKAGSISMIRLGDNTIEYCDDFRFYMSTKLPNPHFAPEICVSVILLNFVTTFDGLTDQLNAVLVAREQPEMEKKRQDLVIESAQSKAQLKEIEDRILHMLSSSTGNFLDDEVLIGTLASSKITSARIEEKLKSQERTAKEVQSTREFYSPVAQRASALFFVVSDLAQVESTYQYSLDWFVRLYLKAIETAPSARGETRLRKLEAQFLKLIYENVCQSLFEKDKLLYSMLLTFKMLDFDDELNHNQLRLFLTGGGGGGQLARPKPQKEWITDVTWGRILELERLPDENFQDFSHRFERDIDAWKKVFDADHPKDAVWPQKLQEQLTKLEEALVLLALRPDAVVVAIQDLVCEKLGAEFIEPPSFNLNLAYGDSQASVPLIFILTTGADPMSELLKLAAEVNMKDKVSLISLGQGQGPKANVAIENGMAMGSWVVLQNCHLATSYMPVLEAKVLDFDQEDVHRDFRLWLTTLPAPIFPVSILQSGIKMTIEPPKGLKENLTRAYLMYDEQWMEGCNRDHAFHKMLFGLSFFHALILGRRKFGPLGWNIPYQFSVADRAISASQLKIFLDEFKEIPYEALNYMAAEANYGGRVTDAQDRRTIVAILKDFYCPDILKDDYKFSPSGIYYAPAITNKAGYLEYIKSLPLNETPEVYSLHQNADLTALINEGMGLLRTAVSLMPRGASSAGNSTEEAFAEIAKDIESKIPSEGFDVEAVERRYPSEYHESLNTVLTQELGRFNKLFYRMHSSVINLQKAAKGLVVFSHELEEVGMAFLDQRQPLYWQKVSFLSLKPLGSYIIDFLKRLDFFQTWVNKGPPVVFWISGLFFPQAFLTGVLQNMARRDRVPIDTCIWNHRVEKAGRRHEEFQKPQKGCYVHGLYMEGAQWLDVEQCIGESSPKVLYTAMPVILFDPVVINAERSLRNQYECPTYKTSARKGVLSTTGHSTNFVTMVFLPIKEGQEQSYWVKRGVALLTQLDE